MKLRNKKTWGIEEACFAMSGDKIAVIVADMPLCGNSVLGEYDSLAELNEEWEDCAPAEPLIKDEKARKAVRAWAEANEINLKHIYNTKDVVFDHAEHSFRWINTSIEFDMLTGLEELEDGKSYTIAELCGTPPEPLEPTFVDLDERVKEKEEE